MTQPTEPVPEPRRGCPTYETIDDWLRLTTTRAHEQADALTALDQAIGDGDFGASLERGSAAVLAVIGAGPPDGEGGEAAAQRLRQAGRALISNVGGASGPLYGTALLRAAEAIRSAGPGASGAAYVVSALEAAAEGIAKLGGASTGEKTMLDALVPAAEAARAALKDGEDAAGVAQAAADAADEGALQTIPMLATKGRASYLGERSIGHQDPGATFAALALRALADTLAR
ncbi:MAG: dihydroxyacetone kinase subunit DhaL [Chloroflexota bacterium]|nr:dihydroxyacetone kinase subunit DhaL [Chloroflexota bacterium]